MMEASIVKQEAENSQVHPYLEAVCWSNHCHKQNLSMVVHNLKPRVYEMPHFE
jgi:hypothetical protein